MCHAPLPGQVSGFFLQSISSGVVVSGGRWIATPYSVGMASAIPTLVVVPRACEWSRRKCQLRHNANSVTKCSKMSTTSQKSKIVPDSGRKPSTPSQNSKVQGPGPGCKAWLQGARPGCGSRCGSRCGCGSRGNRNARIANPMPARPSQAQPLQLFAGLVTLSRRLQSIAKFCDSHHKKAAFAPCIQPSPCLSF